MAIKLYKMRRCKLITKCAEEYYSIICNNKPVNTKPQSKKNRTEKLLNTIVRSTQLGGYQKM